MISLQITQSQLKGYKEELVAKKLARAYGGITKALEPKEGWEKIHSWRYRRRIRR